MLVFEESGSETSKVPETTLDLIEGCLLMIAAIGFYAAVSTGLLVPSDAAATVTGSQALEPNSVRVPDYQGEPVRSGG